VEQLSLLSFTAGFHHKFNYVLRVSDDVKPVEQVIRNQLIPSLCENSTCNNDERKLFSLTVKMGGLELVNVTEMADIEYRTSKQVTHSHCKEDQGTKQRTS